MVSYLNFAGTIANLQGIARIDLDPAPAMTLSDLDQRLRRLEDSQNITPPPALLDPTWESLAWRLCRISRNESCLQRELPHLGRQNVSIFKPLLPFSSLIATHSTSGEEDDTVQSQITLQKASDIVFSIKYSFRSGKQPSQPMAPTLRGPEEKDFAHTVQRLLHVAGDRGLIIRTIPSTTAALYALAADVAIEFEASSKPRPAPMPMRPASIPPAPPRPGQPFFTPGRGFMPCCGCCACTCHKHSADDDSLSDSSTTSSRFRRGKGVLRRVFGFGWMRGLICWRKKDDSSKYDSSDDERIIDP